jgi:signal transduction histidine kinase/DNA-binding response OmpR family regulator
MSHDPIKILLVDDTPESLVALEAVLRRPDCEVVTASSGEDALKFLLKNDCALILLDVRMPGIDGFETARLVRSNERTRPIPIIFLTSASREERFVMRGYEIGAVDFLTKPIDAGVLRAKVAAFVELHRAKEQIARQAALLREHERAERQRVLAELELRSLRRQQAAHERYQRLVAGITHAIVWTVDPATLACTFASPSAETILGYAPGDWLRTPLFWRELMPSEERDRVVDAVRSLQADGESIRLGHTFLAADGRLARFQTELCRIPGDDECGAQVRGFSVDVTELVRAEEELAFLDRAGVDLADSLDLEVTTAKIAHIPIPYLADWCAVDVPALADGEAPVTAVAHREERCREDARRLASSPALAPTWVDGRAQIVPDIAARLARAACADLSSAVLPGAMLVVPLRGRDRTMGTLRLFRCGPRGMYGPHELRIAAELGRRASHAIDNALLYRQAREAVRVRDEFLSIASHELRTPLTPLSLQTEAIERMVAERIPDDRVRSEILRRLATCARQVDRMTRLVLNLLDVSRLRAGRLELQVDSCDLHELTSEITARFQDDLSHSGRRIEVALEGPVLGRWDRSRLDQVLTNLVSNAVRYGGKKPIAVALTRHRTHATVTVSDQGTGIEERDLGRIFERFERGESSRSHGGLGLGLYIARCIVEAHGGTIAVRSRIGEGSTFQVDLPFEPPRPG